MQENSVMRVVYMFFLGLLIAVFVGVGINTFYEQPTEPTFPMYATEKTKTEAELQKEQADYDARSRAYWEQQKIYSRNVSIMVLVAAVILVGASLAYERRSSVIANSMMLGGLFTLLYGIVRSFISGDNKYIFVAVSVGLAVVIYLGYRRFTHEATSEKPVKKR
ncbi:MAG: hypothetical protein WBB39_03385 [Candidatus Saccharimonadales bacterium]